MADIALSLMVLCAAIMVVASFFAFRRGDRKQAGLMLVLAIVLVINIAIWTVPGPGESLGDRAAEGAAAGR